MSELKRIDFEKKEFQANGVIYYIQTPGISAGRFMHYERYSLLATFGTDFLAQFQTWKQLYDTLTTGNDLLKSHSTALTLAYNQMASIKDRMEQKYPDVLMLATLFMNRANEDLSQWDERTAKEKIADWIQEGLDVQDFFLFAVSVIEGYREVYMSPLEKAIAGKGDGPIKS